MHTLPLKKKEIQLFWQKSYIMMLWKSYSFFIPYENKKIIKVEYELERSGH